MNKNTFMSIIKFLIGWPLSLLALFFIARIFLAKPTTISLFFSANLPLLLVSILCFCIYFFLRIIFWKKLLETKGIHNSFQETSFFWSISELQRYIPGNIWSFISRTSFYQKRGVTKRSMATLLLFEVEFLVVAAGVVGLLSLNFLVFGFFHSFPFQKFALPILGSLGLLFTTLWIFQTMVLRKVYKKITVIQHFLPLLHCSSMIMLTTLMAAAFLFFGLGTYFSISSLTLLYLPHLFSLSGFFSFAFLVGYLSLITPMGLGVREGVITVGIGKYIPVSQAAAGAIFSRIILIISELVFVAFSYLYFMVKKSWAQKLEEIIVKRKYEIFIILAIALYCGYFILASFLRYQNFYTGRFDLGNMDQTVWNTIHGRIFQLTNPDGTTIISRLAFHADFILILLAPFYLIWQDPRMLLVIQTVILAGGSIFIYLIGKKVLNNKALSCILAITYLINPSVNNTNLYDFHGVTLATTFLLGSWYFLLSGRMIFFSLFLFLAGITKEEIWVITGLLGITALLRKKVTWGISIALLSFITFYIVFFKAIPLARGGDHFALAYYSDFGTSPSGVIKGIIFSPIKTITTILQPGQLTFLWELFSPLGLLSLFSPAFLLFAIPDFAIDLLSNNTQLHSIVYQYTAALTPFIFLGTIYGIAFILKHFQRIPPKILAAYILLFALGSAYLFGPLPGAKTFNYYMFTQPLGYSQDVDAFLNSIPRRYSVAATNNIGSHLSHRQHIFTIPVGIDKADIIVMLLNDPYAQPSLKAQITLANTLRNDPRYTEVFHENDFDVFAKKNVKLLAGKNRNSHQPLFPLFK